MGVRALLPVRVLEQAFTPRSPPSGEAGTVSRESSYMSSFRARLHCSSEPPQRRGSGSPAWQWAAPPCPELQRSRPAGLSTGLTAGAETRHLGTLPPITATAKGSGLLAPAFPDHSESHVLGALSPGHRAPGGPANRARGGTA